MGKTKPQTSEYEAEPLKPRVTAKVQILQPETPSATYTNYIEVSHSEYEFALSCAKLPAKLRPQQLLDVQAGEPLLLEPLLQIEVPTRLIKGFIRALKIQVDLYEKRYGPIYDSAQEKGGSQPDDEDKKNGK